MPKVFCKYEVSISENIFSFILGRLPDNVQITFNNFIPKDKSTEEYYVKTLKLKYTFKTPPTSFADLLPPMELIPLFKSSG